MTRLERGVRRLPPFETDALHLAACSRFRCSQAIDIWKHAPDGRKEYVFDMVSVMSAKQMVAAIELLKREAYLNLLA